MCNSEVSFIFNVNVFVGFELLDDQLEAKALREVCVCQLVSSTLEVLWCLYLEMSREKASSSHFISHPIAFVIN